MTAAYSPNVFHTRGELIQVIDMAATAMLDALNRDESAGHVDAPVHPLTNGFSKKLENHSAAVALHYMHYNFARIHKR